MGRIEQLLRAQVGSGELVGVAGAVVDDRGHRLSVIEGVRGPGGAAMSLEVPFPAAGPARPLLAVAALQLAEDGRVGLDADVDRVLPELGGRRVLTGFGPGHEPVWRRAGRPITMRRLLTHTSGLFPPIPPAPAGRANPVTDLLAEPGTRWFHGAGLPWAALLLQRVAPGGLVAYLRRRVFEPLGMTGTGFATDGAINACFTTPGDAPAAGAAHRGRPAAAASAIEQLRTNQIGALSVPETSGPDTVRTPDEINTYPEMRLHPGLRRRWSLGFLVTTQPVPGGPRAGTLTCSGGPGVDTWWDPAGGVAGVLFARRAGAGGHRVRSSGLGPGLGLGADAQLFRRVPAWLSRRPGRGVPAAAAPVHRPLGLGRPRPLPAGVPIAQHR